MQLDDGGPLVLDACGAINLEAAFGLKNASACLGRRLLIVNQAALEVEYLYDIVNGERRRVSIDVGPLEVVHLSENELADFVVLTTGLGDGEAATLAAARARRLPVMSDDRIACRAAASLVPPVLTITTPQVMKAWHTARQPPTTELARVLRAVETRASFSPRRTDPDATWWASAAEHSAP